MADNYLITGYWGEPHVTAENDRGINAAVFGTGRFVLPVGEQFKAEYIGNNTIRMYDGKLMDNGAAAGIPAGEYIDLLIPETGQGMNRNDLIVFQYSQDASTLIESGVFTVIHGAEASDTASDPELTHEDLLSGEATFDQMALWRVSVSGAVISDPVQLFEVSKNIKNAGVSVVEATSSDGVAYYATVPGVTELYAGLEITIIPNIASASTAPTLNVNGLGAKNIRLPVSTNTAMLAQPDTETYYVDGRPIKLMYDPKFVGKGAWVAVDKQRQSGNDIYGSVPVKKGGTGADNAEEARENLGVAPATESSDHPGCYYRIANGVTEWVNPPMIPGTEYRTTERYKGKAVYYLALSTGEIAANTKANINIEVFGATEIIYCYIKDVRDPGSNLVHQWGYPSGHISYDATTVNVFLFNAYGSEGNWTVILKYIKN